ncbi:MAG: SPFH domain-containing protein [Desulfobacteraceae bacterium]|nr:SPFH domain-containing protein [Desulfobacteraceae bacterium]
MGLWDKVKGQFIDVIEWTDDTGDTLVWKFPRGDNEIKNGAQLIVRESQEAVFLHEGELGDVFAPGSAELTTRNIPVLTTLKSWKYGFDSPFKSDIFFVSTRQFTDLKWGTKNPIMMRDAEFGPVRLRAFGSYCIQVNDPGLFIMHIAGTGSWFHTDEITGQLRNILTSRFADALAEAKIPMLDLAANYNEMGDLLLNKLQPEFQAYGVTLTKFLIENISVPQAVEKALDKRTQMGVVGNLQSYTQFQTAEAIESMANNPNATGNAMGMFAGVGMGNIMGGAMQGASQQSGQVNQQSEGQQSGPPPLPQSVQWYAAINNQQAGPFSADDIKHMIQNGQLNRKTLIWKQGMPDWQPAGNQPELTAFFGSVPPPLPKG